MTAAVAAGMSIDLDCPIFVSFYQKPVSLFWAVPAFL